MPNLEPYIRLVCEGRKTEPNYFNSLLRSIGIKSANPAFKPKDHSPLGVARAAMNLYQEAVKLKIPKSNRFIFAVFDNDGHAGVADAIDDRPVWERNPYTDVHKAVIMIRQPHTTWSTIFETL